jgi:hypothetical protein
MNGPPQAPRPGGFQSVFTGPVGAPVRASTIQQPGIQSNIRPSPYQPFPSQIQTFPSGPLPNQPQVQTLPSGPLPSNSVPESGIRLDMPPDEGVIHNIKEIRMPPKPKSFKFG